MPMSKSRPQARFALVLCTLALWPASHGRASDQGASTPAFWPYGPRSMGADALRLSQRSSSHATRGGSDWMSHLKRAVSHPLLRLRKVSRGTNLRLLASKQPTDFVVEHQGLPLCQVQIRVSQLNGGRTLMLGSLPALKPDMTPPLAEFPDSDMLARELEGQLKVPGEPVQVLHHHPCFWVSNGGLEAVTEADVLAGDWPYRIWLGHDGVKELRPMFVAAEGSALVYRHNSVVNKQRESLPLSDLTGDGTLRDRVMNVQVSDAYADVHAADHRFEFAEDSDEFAQTSSFQHAQAHRLWLEGLGLNWPDSERISIQVHQNVSPSGLSDPNNAYYSPGSGGRPSKIVIGDGDGIELKDLALDSDVVSHELGHHVVFNSVTSTKGESMVIHEALADFLVFARSGDPCLAESTCVAGSEACYVRDACLRSAATDLRYGNAAYKALGNKLGHRHAQAVSGVLWAIMSHKVYSDGNDAARLVLGAISLLSHDSGLQDLMLALLAADEEQFAGLHQGALAYYMDEYGFGGMLDAEALAAAKQYAQGRTQESASKEQTSGNFTSVNQGGAAVGTQVATSVETASALGPNNKPGRKNSEGSSLACGVTGGGTPATAAWLLLLLPLVPLIAGQVRRRMAPVRLRARPTRTSSGKAAAKER